MNVFINGNQIVLPEQATIESALSVYFKQQTTPSFALALNQEFVGKASYPETQLNCGDSIDIMLPIQGG